MPKVICPDCNKVFNNRKTLTEHKAKTGHKGGAIIYTEPKKKESSQKKQTKADKGNGKKPFGCPSCGKRFKNEKALQNHQRDKKHFDIKRVLGGATPISMKTLPAAKEVKKEQETPVEDIIPPSELIGNAFVVIKNSDYENIMQSLDILKQEISLDNISFSQLKYTDSWLVSYALKDEDDWDYILFYCDFVEIEHTLESFLALQDRIDLDKKPKVFDMASLDSRTGVSNDIYDTNECLFISHESDEVVSYGELIITINERVKSEANPLTPEDILLIGGSWAKPIPPTPLVKKEKTVMSQKWTTRDWIDVPDEYYGVHMWAAEGEGESPSEADEGEVVGEVEEDKIETIKTNPVYIITDDKLFIDKLVNVELVVIPKENPSEDDVKKKVNIEDDVQEEVNIEDDVQEEVNIEDDVQEEVNTDGSETITVKKWFEIMRQNENNLFLKLYWEQEGVSLDWLNENAEWIGTWGKWEDLEWSDVVISIRNKTKEDTSEPIFYTNPRYFADYPRHILLYTHFKLNDDNDLEYDEYKLLFSWSELARMNKDKDPNLLYLPLAFGKVEPYGTSNHKKKKHPLKRFYPKTGNKRNYYLFPDSRWNASISQEEKSS